MFPTKIAYLCCLLLMLMGVACQHPARTHSTAPNPVVVENQHKSEPIIESIKEPNPCGANPTDYYPTYYTVQEGMKACGFTYQVPGGLMFNGKSITLDSTYMTPRNFVNRVESSEEQFKLILYRKVGQYYPFALDATKITYGSFTHGPYLLNVDTGALTETLCNKYWDGSWYGISNDQQYIVFTGQQEGAEFLCGFNLATGEELIPYQHTWVDWKLIQPYQLRNFHFEWTSAGLDWLYEQQSETGWKSKRQRFAIIDNAIMKVSGTN